MVIYSNFSQPQTGGVFMQYVSPAHEVLALAFLKMVDDSEYWTETDLTDNALNFQIDEAEEWLTDIISGKYHLVIGVNRFGDHTIYPALGE